MEKLPGKLGHIDAGCRSSLDGLVPPRFRRPSRRPAVPDVPEDRAPALLAGGLAFAGREVVGPFHIPQVTEFQDGIHASVHILQSQGNLLAPARPGTLFQPRVEQEGRCRAMLAGPSQQRDNVVKTGCGIRQTQRLASRLTILPANRVRLGRAEHPGTLARNLDRWG
jgi:hypothetical protein